MADAADSKSADRKVVWVQVPPPAFMSNIGYSLYAKWKWIGRAGALVLFVMLLSFACVSAAVPAFAEETQELTKEEERKLSEVNYRVNPVYADLYTEADLDAPYISRAERSGAARKSGKSTGVTYCKSVSEAAEIIRTHLRAHETMFDIGYTEYGGIDNAVWTDAVDKAMEHTGDPKEGDYLLMQYAGFSSQYISYTNSGGRYYGVLRFCFTWFTTTAQEKVVDQYVSSIIADMNKVASDDYDRLRFLYDYVCNAGDYDEYNLEDEHYMLAHTAYALLVNRRAVCQGFATLLYRLLLEAGIDARYIRGFTPGPDDKEDDENSHGWNIAKLGSRYYNLDPTWDAALSPYSYFLRGSSSFEGHKRRDEYDTAAFNSRYPMSGSDYAVPEQKVTGSGIIYTLHGGEASVTGYTGSPTAVSVPSTLNYEGKSYAVTSVSGHAFNGCTSLVSVQLPSSVRIIENGETSSGTTKGAFASCTSLKTVKIAAGSVLRRIGYGAFYRCTSLAELTFPSLLAEIGAGAFYGCSKLSQIDLPGSVSVIADGAFYGTGSGTITIRNRNAAIRENTETIDSKKSIRGYENSTADDYAAKFGRAFTALDGGSSHTHTRTGKEVLREATCLETGIIRYHCAECGATEDEETPKAAHSYTQKVTTVERNCGIDGKVTRYCEICGKRDVETLPATGDHHFGKWETLIAPTVLKGGTKIRTCPDCGKQERKAVPKLTPTYEKNADALILRKGQKCTVFKIYGLADGDYVKSWKSADKTVASVKGKKNGTCTITAKKKGKTVIRAKLVSGEVIEVPVTVQKKKVRTGAISISADARISMKAGKTKKVRVQVTPITTEEKLKVIRSKKSVLDVTVTKDGASYILKIKAKKAGKCVLRIKSGKVYRKIAVTVNSAS